MRCWDQSATVGTIKFHIPCLSLAGSPLCSQAALLAGRPSGHFSAFLFIKKRETENNIMIPLCLSADAQQNSLQADLNSLWFLTFLTISVTENPVQRQLNP